MLYHKRRPVVYSLLLIVLGCVVLGISRPIGAAGSWFNSAGLLLDIVGLALLEISGVFQKIADYLQEADARGEPLPSRYVREVIDNPEPGMRDHFEKWLFADVRAGVQMIVAGCVLQLLGTWL